jgi:DNA-binding NarL/FixJ family response regulator
MAKKRPRTKKRRASKIEPKYWKNRLFRSSFSYRGKLHEVNHWSVKIQHLGHRKTFSLTAEAVAAAAAEACEIYKAILSRGWKKAMAEHKEKSVKVRMTSGSVPDPERGGLDAAYWRPRLIRRKYIEAFRSNAEFSVRIDHSGTSFYFSLGTDNPALAAKNAALIFRTVKKQDWENACKRFPRELSVAFRWSDNPLAWTYTTIQTQTDSERKPAIDVVRACLARLKVGIVESDAGARQALSWCISREDGCCCVASFANAAAATDEARRRSIDLFLVSQNLSDKPGIECLNELNCIDPKAYALLFSVFEDSEQLFKAAPGGAPCYVFRRTLPTSILAPIQAALKDGSRTREHFKKSIRRYFEETVLSSPIHGSANELSNLTQREHEILGLLSKGHPDKEIAGILRISTWTVHGHLKKIFEKLGAHNRTDAVVRYLNK